MRVQEKKVYYCDFCKKHGLSRAAMEKHERICTLNPLRVCRWMGNEHPEIDYTDLVAQLRKRAPLTEREIDWLRSEVQGCPACMLAALRQSELEYHFTPTSGNLWDYKEEIERFRKDEREAENYAEFSRTWA